MSKIFFVLFFSLIILNPSIAQILPKEGSNLNYRLIGFSFPEVSQVNKFNIEIATGNYSSEDSFNKHISQSLYSKNSKIVAEVPSFGTQYTWRTVYTDNSITTKSGLHHFSTASAREVDTNYMRLRIIKKAERYKDAFVFLDGHRVLYDMQGRPIWFLPDVDRFNIPGNTQMHKSPSITGPITPTNDMKLTSRGTISFLMNEAGYEVNYNGDILWKAPDADKVNSDKREFYHHEFTMLSNGHFMALKNDFQPVYRAWKHTTTKDSSIVIVPVNEISSTSSKVFGRNTELAIIKEYDQKGNVVWSWNSSAYFIDIDKGKDLDYCARINLATNQEVHANSLYFDEHDSVIYIGFRNINRILKMQYPSGKILATYGADAGTAADEPVSSLFCYQHSCRKSPKGYLYLYNNNVCNAGHLPGVQVLQEPVNGKDNLKKIWEYICAFEPADKEKEDGSDFPTGGNVIELPDQSMLVDMGSKYSKVFIVDRDKKILWSAMPEIWDLFDKKWENTLQYRVSIILNRKEMERLVWDAEHEDGTQK